MRIGQTDHEPGEDRADRQTRNQVRIELTDHNQVRIELTDH